MENLDRRSLFAIMSAVAALGAAGPARAEDAPILSNSKVFKFSDLPVRKFPNGGEQRRVTAGTLTTGEFIEVHETMLPAGQSPHASHKHPNSELVFMQTGQCEFIDDDGKLIPVGPGDIIFTASNKMHGLKNVGTIAATYIVVSVSKQLSEG